jgi:hypothetical protein
MSGRKKDEVAGEWKRLNNAEHCGFVVLAKGYSDDQMNNKEMGEADFLLFAMFC